MTKEYKILQTKVNELESKLTVIISFPTETTVPKSMLEDFRQQLGFVRNILSAELSSGPSKPHRLSRISARLDHLDDIFRRWSVGDFDSCNIDEEIGIHDDGASTGSSFNDDGEAENMAIVEYHRVEAPSLEEDFKDCLAAGIGEHGTEKRGLFARGWFRVRRIISFVLGFVLICFVGFVFLFFGCRIEYYGHRQGFENFLTPT